eukprot:m.16764 g.16764  ORF g.16764 m.16764 type:complete len:299 (-) comp8043_c0_seq1:114-1010(-)
MTGTTTTSSRSIPTTGDTGPTTTTLYTTVPLTTTTQVTTSTATTTVSSSKSTTSTGTSSPTDTTSASFSTTSSTSASASSSASSSATHTFAPTQTSDTPFESTSTETQWYFIAAYFDVDFDSIVADGFSNNVLSAVIQLGIEYDHIGPINIRRGSVVVEINVLTEDDQMVVEAAVENEAFLVNVNGISYSASSTNPDNPQSSKSSPLNATGIALLVVAIVVILAVIGVVCFVKRSPQTHTEDASSEFTNPNFSKSAVSFDNPMYGIPGESDEESFENGVLHLESEAFDDQGGYLSVEA